LAVPLAGVSLLRLYDSMLIRQTESELISQGAALAAVYLNELARQAPSFGLEADGAGHMPLYGVPAAPSLDLDERFRPGIASLDLARHPVLPPMPPGRAPADPADPLAEAVGERLAPILRQTQRTTLAGLRLLDSSGTVIATSGSEGGLDLTERPEVRAALDGYRSSVLRRRDIASTPPLGSVSRGTGLRVVVAFPVTLGRRVVAAVVLARTPMSVSQALYRDRRYFLLGGVVTLAAVGLLAMLTAATLGRPMRALIEQTERVRRGEKGAAQPLVRPVTREVAQISEAVASMASDLEQRADYIATFAANVSHEFKTPLTSIRGTVELLRDHHDGGMSAEERVRFLTILEKDAARLERLVSRLLELARADVLRPSGRRQQIGAAVGAAARRYLRRGVALETDAAPEASERSVAIGSEALDSVLSNLLENALQHGGERVRLRARVEGERALLEVEDDGPGISESNRARVFDRFFTTRRGEGGSGLGLSISRSLVAAHGGEIRVRSRAGCTVFTVALPLAPEEDGR
ncbi:MAG: HAMP domain-containing sensor histidine kinase, partial [Acidobacteriota bacterium]